MSAKATTVEAVLPVGDAFNRTLVESSRDCLTILSLEGHLLWMNDEGRRTLGITDLAEALGNSWIGFWPAEDRDTAQAAVSAAAAGGSGHFSAKCVVEDRERWFDVLVSSIRGPEDEVQRLLASSRDITSHVRLEQQLSLTTNSIPALISYVDRQARYTFCNQAYTEWFGLDREQIIGHTMAEVLGEDVWRVLRPHVEAALAGKTVTYETEAPYAHGPPRWIHATYTPHLDLSGQVAGIVVMVLDITDRKHAEKIGREQARLLDLSSDAIIIRGLDGTIRYWNKGAENMYGWTAAEAIHKNIHTLLKTVFPDPREEVERQLEQAGSWTGELLHTRRDGTQITVLCRKVYDRDHAGLAHAVLETNTDISERKRAEQALHESETVLRTVANGARVGLVLLSKERRYIFANQTYADIMGLQRDAIIGRTVAEVIKDLYVQVEPYLDRAFRDERLRYELVIPDRPVPGEESVVEITYEPRLQNKEPYIIVVIADITDRKRSEQRMEKLIADRTATLRETVGELEAFSYEIVHDMRAPLRAMQSFSSILTDEHSSELSPPAKDLLARIGASATRLDELIKDVLSYSKIVRRDLRLEPVDPNVLINELIHSYPNLASNNAQIRIPEKLPLIIGNRSALTQVFSNLLGNAVKFIARGVQPIITIRSEPANPREPSTQHPTTPSLQPPHPRMVRIWIEDNGTGIPAHEMPKLFHMFHRGHSAADYEGTGMGLAIVKKAVERMGGRVGVESELGKGSRFWMELPAVD